MLEGEVELKTALWVLTHPATYQLPYGGALIEQLTSLLSALR